ncbi:MAG: RNA-binding domain-containing protein [Coleofasciculaceae cyanobacterium]
MSLDFKRTRDLLDQFNFGDLFIEVLGWSQPSNKKTISFEVEDQTYYYQRIAEISGVAIFEITTNHGKIPEAKQRDAIHKEITERIAENLIIFVDQERTRSLWYWVKRDGIKRYFRDHVYIKGQPGDLFLSKLSSLVIDIADLENGEPSVVAIAKKLQDGFDIERVTKKFYQEYQEQHYNFLQFVQGIDSEVDCRWYTSVILNRLMFVYFLQRKGFIDNEDLDYLQNKYIQSKQKGENRFFNEFLQTLFFEGFAKPEDEREDEVKALIGQVKYLNGGLFLKHRIEQNYPNINIADAAFEQILDLFSRYSWNLDDTPGGKDDEINPDVLGYIFEKYINQKAFGAYYTRPEITEYLCDRTINKLILDRVNASFLTPLSLDGRGVGGEGEKFSDINELLIKLDSQLCDRLIHDILPNLSLLDPACGSGAFLIAAMKTLISVYSAVVGTIELKGDRRLKNWLKGVKADHPSLSYYVKKRIITDNLYGVDIMEEATEIAKLRLFLALVSSAQEVEELEPLPNIDFNIMAGNSLIGLIRVDETRFDDVGESRQGNLLQSLAASKYKQILDEKNKNIDLYKKHAFQSEAIEGTSQNNRLQRLRNEIDKLNRDSYKSLNQLLLDEFNNLNIKYEEAQLQGKPKKRVLKIEDIEALKPFHWGYHFDKIIEERGGFDAIITNPPWEIFKPNAREFSVQHNKLFKNSKTDIKEFEKETEKLLKSPEITKAWLEYQSNFTYVSAYYRSSEHYKKQISIVNGIRFGTDINFYKLFLEQCFNLLHSGGYCVIILPAGIYIDPGTKQLREMLFSESRLESLFSISNEGFIFEDVNRHFKFCLLIFEKGGYTDSFKATFCLTPQEAISSETLNDFLVSKSDKLNISVSLLRQLSPDLLSIIEFKNETDVYIVEKITTALQPFGEKLEFHLIKDSFLFKEHPAENRLPLYEGKMIHQFIHQFTAPRYWIDEQEGEKALLERSEAARNQKLDYQNYRFVYRSIASSTNSRTLIGTVLPPKVFCANSLNVLSSSHNVKSMVFHCAMLNSFCFDFLLRQRVYSTTLTISLINQIPVPRLMPGNRFFNEIVHRAAQLICTTPEFDELAQEVGAQGIAPMHSHKDGVTDETQRAQLRAELDGMIAHLYNLTEDEFKHILSTFPIVPEATKQAALEAFHTFTPLIGDSEIIDLITKGESNQLEFKSSARWDMRENKPNKIMEEVILKTVAGFLNSYQGGTLLIGIDDDSNILGLNHDYQTFKKKNRDGYELFLINDLLLKELGKDLSPHIHITFHQVEGKDICRIILNPCPRPVYINIKDAKSGQTKECFFLRTGNLTSQLDTPSAIHNYCKNRWS